jgi:hypothetical protein
MAQNTRQRNEQLAALIDASGWSYEACAAAIRAVDAESGGEMAACQRSHIAKWVAGIHPSGRAPYVIAEAFSRRLGYLVSPADLGFNVEDNSSHDLNRRGWWQRNPVADLVTVGRADLHRRDFAASALYSLAALAVPLEAWGDITDRGQRAATAGGPVGRGEIDSVRQMIAVFSASDERFGGGSGRTAATAYLATDVAAYLRGSFSTDDARRQMYSAAAELAYLIGWKAFDSAEHGLAQTYYLRALRLANEAGDGPLGGFVLRAMAHQAVDLGHGQPCVQLADASLEWAKANATPGAAALFTVVKARGYAAQRHSSDAVATMNKAERLLSAVDWDSEPIWIHRMGFGEPSLANQTAQSLRDLGDLTEAERQFRRSVNTRNGGVHRRIHALTLAHLADIEFSRGELSGACKHWSKSLDNMAGLQSARATQAVRNLRARLATLGQRMPAEARQLDERATAILSAQAAA